MNDYFCFSPLRLYTCCRGSVMVFDSHLTMTGQFWKLVYPRISLRIPRKDFECIELEIFVGFLAVLGAWAPHKQL